MEPIVLIHGYSAESRGTDLTAITGIYGTLPQALRDTFGRDVVVEIDLSRYVSLEDGVTIDDISRGLDRALREEFSHLLNGAFHVLVHSTGALVIRNWIRRYSRQPSPIRKLVYLAGANLGSGWAHIGKGQLAQWARFVFQAGAERGVQVLDALELGSDWTLDLHLHFLNKGSMMAADYRIQEHVIVGTQADVKWYEVPIRYAKEDGSDGVVRVSASNVNFNYVRFGPTEAATTLDFASATKELARHRRRVRKRTPLYEIKETSKPGDPNRPEVPFAIPYECAHSGDEMGIVIGAKPREQVTRLLKLALETPADQWSNLVQVFRDETAATYEKALAGQAPPWWKKWIDEPRAQYDPHAQVIFRVRDQDGRPVEHFDVFFDSAGKGKAKARTINTLFEDKHLNEQSPNIIVFCLRTDEFVNEQKRWIPRVPEVNGCFLEVSAVEPETGQIIYLPMRYEFTSDQLTDWIQGHRTTLIDVQLLRLPAPEIFKVVRFSP